MTGLLHSSTRRRSPGLVVLAAAGLIALLLALDPAPRTPYPVDAEATHAMLGASLLHDGDALYRPEDLRRAYRSWTGGPRGLRLAPVDGEREHGFAVSPLYAVLTLPFRAVLGRRGPLVANGLALAAAALLVWRRLGRRTGGGGRATAAWWLAAATGSAALVYALLPQPQALLMAAVAAAATLWLDHREAPESRRAPWAVAGLLLGLAAAAQWSLAVVAIAVAADLALLRRRRALGALLLTAVVTFLAAMALWGALTGGGWGAGAVRVYAGELPLTDTLAEAPPETGAGPAPGEMREGRPPAEPAGRVSGSHPLGWRRLAVESWYWLCGRSGGLVVLFPGALLALVAGAWSARDRPEILLLAAAVAVAAAAVVVRAAAVPGEAGTLGARGFAAVFPLLLLAAGRPPPKPLLGLGAGAAAIWTLPALVAVLATGAPADPSAGGPLAALRLLPAELTRFHDAERFGWTAAARDGWVWVTPARLTSPAGGDDRFWLRGDARAEVWVAAPRTLDEVALTARALSPHGSIELRSAGARVTARFDTRDKRAGTPLVVPVAPRTAGLGVFARREVFHRLTAITGAGVPDASAAGAGAHDGPPRYPGVLLDLDPDFRVGPRPVHEARRDAAGSR